MKRLPPTSLASWYSNVSPLRAASVVFAGVVTLSCGDSDVGATGATAGGGAAATSNGPAAPTGGAPVNAVPGGGAPAAGGSLASGGATPALEGAAPSGGSTAAGGATQSGGAAPVGGAGPSGGTGPSGGAAPVGGAGPSGGAAPEAAAGPSGGAAPVGGAGPSGGAAPVGGAGPSGGAAPEGGAGPSGGAEAQAGAPAEPAATDERPWFTFFTTSEAGIRRLAPDAENGFGGDLGGLAGADNICAELAKSSNPGDTKTWRAFLSATDDGQGKVVHAIERIGQGPWHDFNNRLFANDIAGLMPVAGRQGGRPNAGDPQLAEMFTDENGDPVSPDKTKVDNHDMLTGSDSQGRLMGGKKETCQDWTSKDGRANTRPAIGHAWPRSARSGRNWMSEHSAGGCAPGIDTRPQGTNGTNTVGAGGGYGGLYCFALTE